MQQTRIVDVLKCECAHSDTRMESANTREVLYCDVCIKNLELMARKCFASNCQEV